MSFKTHIIIHLKDKMSWKNLNWLLNFDKKNWNFGIKDLSNCSDQKIQTKTIPDQV